MVRILPAVGFDQDASVELDRNLGRTLSSTSLVQRPQTQLPVWVTAAGVHALPRQHMNPPELFDIAELLDRSRLR